MAFINEMSAVRVVGFACLAVFDEEIYCGIMAVHTVGWSCLAMRCSAIIFSSFFDVVVMSSFVIVGGCNGY
ncbi:unnamed protein product [Camellia sinensis]